MTPALPASTPLPVEIIDHTDWWQPYVPPLVGLVGSILVAVVALYSVHKSNKTNERAIESADAREREKWQIDSERERDKWHRDNLLRICSEAVRVSREISHPYNEAAAACLKSSDLDLAENAFRVHMDAAQAAIDKVAPLSYDMQLLGETNLYMEFKKFAELASMSLPHLNSSIDISLPTTPASRLQQAAL
jgi:hypothetical protein